MVEQTKQFPGKKIIAFPFIGGMLVVGVLWVASSLVMSTSRLRVSDSSYYTGNEIAPGGKALVDSDGMAAPQVVGNMTQERRVTSNYLSVHVKNVKDIHTEVTSFIDSVKGKVMSEYVTVSTDDQSESGTMSVLVPNTESDKFFALVESKAIKVVDRQVNSYQITQEYTDIGRQLAQYEQTYEKILSYYDKADSVTDLLQIQSQLDQVQKMIDSLKGRRAALDELSNNTQYTIYSSTNEFNLPYVPQGTFEFAKTFKLAVRSLVATADSLVSGVIYLVVYIPLFALVLLLGWAIKKWAQKWMK